MKFPEEQQAWLQSVDHKEVYRHTGLLDESQDTGSGGDADQRLADSLLDRVRD
jgi:hypothetical protein